MNMDTGCLEIVVERKTSALMKILRVGSVFLTVLFIFAMFLFGWPFLFAAIAMGIAGYFIWLECEVDYEYAYVEKELRISKILRKSSRKEIASYDLNQLEIMAPTRSHELDSFHRSDKIKVSDYSSGEPEARDLYDLCLSDGTCLRLNLSGEYAEQLIRIMKQYAPRKVFTY